MRWFIEALINYPQLWRDREMWWAGFRAAIGTMLIAAAFIWAVWIVIMAVAL